jgi:signal transduction histidine kinase/DNA-binding response OmpR family regulator/ligand-binding sensor domain-containing protein
MVYNLTVWSRLFRPEEKHFTHLGSMLGDKKELSSEYYYGIDEDSKGNVWVVSNYGVIEKIDGETLDVLERIEVSPQKTNTTYFNLFIDREDELWIYAQNNALGAYKYDPKNKKVTHFSNQPGKFKVSSDIITGVIQDDEGIVWLSSDHGGINLFNKKSYEIRFLKHDPFEQSSISANNIVTMFKDRYGTIWLGTFKDGIDCYHKDAFLFNLIKDNPLNINDINENDVNCITEDPNGFIWFGTNGSGLIRYDRKGNKFKQFRHSPDDFSSLSNDVIVTIKTDSNDQLWIGTYFGGLNRYDGNRFYRFLNDPNSNQTLSDNRVFSIHEDSKRNLWVGTLGGGLNLYNKDKNIFYHYRDGDINSIVSDFIFDIKEDRKGNIWIATAVGLSRFIIETGRFLQYVHEENNPRSLSNNNLLSLYIDRDDNLWVGAREGLNRFNYETNDFDVIRKEQGLPDNYICSIVGDDLGNLWIATPYNLSKMVWPSNNQTKEMVITQYSESDGLQGGEFNVNSAFRTSNGEIFIGGTKGVNYFNPNLIKDLPSNGQLVMTGFSLFNRPISIGEKVNNRILFKQSFYQTEKIELKHNENMFSIEFSDLFFLRNDFDNFYYKLEGFNTEWLMDEKKNRTAHFTNLNPGEYTFVVRKARNLDATNFVEKKLTIVIKPPFWKSSFAYLLYFLGIIGALLLAREVVLARERIKAESEMEHQQANMLREMDMMKLRFFTNISHELKTPLSLILSPIEDLLKETKDTKQFNQLQLIHRNALRLYNMVNQLLDFRKMEAQKVELTLSEGDFVSFVRNAVDSFADMANKKEIDLEFTTQFPQLFIAFDKRKIERILFNLLSNAFKFTPGNGKVEVMIAEHDNGIPDDYNILIDKQFDHFIELKVCDNGIGIHPDNHQKIFDRFFQEAAGPDGYNEGSGIGLSITREFARLMGGDVSVVSEKNKGSAFTVFIPLRLTAQAELAETDEEVEQKAQKQQPTLLIVEDNDDFRAYIKQGFDEQYHIIEAADGNEGLRQAFASLPDLIISDVMMPVMDGIEMCRRIKSDIRTSHIPVILLTAVNNQQKMLDGFEIGADDYITKPFNPEILGSRIRNLIDQREKLHKNFKIQLKMEPKEVAVTSLDEKMIGKAIEVVERNIADPEFSVTDLSKELGMSRVNLYKKLKSLTGHTPIEFIRAFRIKRAAQLLAKSQMGVSEVAYQVGFNDPRYFTRYFKSEFNMLPSEYARQHRGKPEDHQAEG